jgi:hypothetical protein
VERKKLRRKSKLGLKKGSGRWRPTPRQVFWAIGVVVTLMTIALLVVQLYPGLWEDVSREWGTCGDALPPVTYIQAWEHWASGSPDNVCLETWKLELSLRWWGRIGKLVEFMGSVLIVADILPLKEYAASLKKVVPSFDSIRSATWEERWGIAGALSSIFLVVAVVTYIVHYGFDDYMRCATVGNVGGTSEAEWRCFRQALPFIILWWGGGIGFVLLFCFIVGFVIPKLIFEPLADVLGILPRWAKVLNLVLIVVAFHFDLLAS